jgi:hypothetical protein
MSLCTSFFATQLGRKRTIILGNLSICIGAVLQASSYSVAQILVGRIVTGSGIGCIASSVPTYMAETLDDGSSAAAPESRPWVPRFPSGRSCAASWRLLTFGFYCPETTGRTLEEIDVLFAKPGPRMDAPEAAAAAAAAAGRNTGRGGSVVSARHAHSGKFGCCGVCRGQGVERYLTRREEGKDDSVVQKQQDVRMCGMKVSNY